ncbi:MAG: methyltransferase domain-containing protein [Anaerolineae bacterium]|nr:methyltransferase domain-containing protein [Anaerolineae bacterium]
MNQEHDPYANVHFYERQVVTLTRACAGNYPLETGGRILDVGGGGEGVIGQLKGAQVVAIDLRWDELAEAPAGPLKSVMDARAPAFLAGSFVMATAFYSLMYVADRRDVARIFAGVARVLQTGGRFLIWDVVIPTRPVGMPKDIVAFPVTVHLPDRSIDTGYGTRWPWEEKTPVVYRDIAAATGFWRVTQVVNGHSFFLWLERSPE